MEKRQELALILLADAVASELENTQSSLLKKVVRPQTDIIENVRELAREHNISLIPYLPMGHIKKIEDAYNNTKWAKVLSFDDLIEEYDTDAGRLVLNAVGHGVSLEDDNSFDELKEEHSLDDFDMECSLESPYDDAYSFVDTIYRAMIHKE